MTAHIRKESDMTKYPLAAALVATVLLANWLVQHTGGEDHAVDVALGLQAPAAVYVVGLALVLRDAVQRAGGVRLAIGAILAGAALSLIVSPAFAVASATAFLVSELADLAVYTPLRRRGAFAILASNLVGAVVDSVIFLTIAFSSLAFLEGQVVGKLLATCVVVALVAGWQGARRPQEALA